MGGRGESPTRRLHDGELQREAAPQLHVLLRERSVQRGVDLQLYARRHLSLPTLRRRGCWASVGGGWGVGVFLTMDCAPVAERACHRE